MSSIANRHIGVLPRRLGLLGGASLVISNILGPGVFGTTGLLAEQLGEPLLILAVWVVGACFALAGAVCYAELAINFPRAGGEFLYLREAYGSGWGFAAGWLSFLAGFSAPIAAASLLAADYLLRQAPGVEPSAGLIVEAGLVSLRLSWREGLAALLVVAFTLLNLRGLGSVGRVQAALTLSILALVAGFLVCAVFTGEGSWSRLVELQGAAPADAFPQRLALCLTWVMFSFSGWNAVVYVAEEVRDPDRNLPGAILLGAGLTAVVCLALNAVFLYAVPVEEMAGVEAVGALAADRLLGEGSASLFQIMLALTMLASVSAMSATGPRVYYAMAREGAFFRFARRVNAHGVPGAAVLAQGFAAVLLVFLPFAGLLSYIGVSLTACTALTVVALLRFRKRPGWRRLRVPSFATSLAPVGFLVTSALMIFGGASAQPWPTLLAGAAVAAAGAVFPLAIRRRPTNKTSG